MNLQEMLLPKIDKQLNEATALVVKQAMKQILGREPLPKDAKDFKILKMSSEMDARIQYKDIIMGKIVYHISDSLEISITYNPIA